MAMLKHTAVSLDDLSDWCRKRNTQISQACGAYFRNMANLLGLQTKLKIPVLTVLLLSDNIDKSTDDYMVFCGFMADFFRDMCNNPQISEHQIKVSVFGKWYKLPGKAIESIKGIVEQTKNNSNFFLNLCVNYDGQEEIVDACKLVVKQVELGKLDSEMVTKDFIRESLYSSYFPPPEIIFIYGERRLSGLLLWDSVNSEIAFANKPFMEFDEEDFRKITEDL